MDERYKGTITVKPYLFSEGIKISTQMKMPWDDTLSPLSNVYEKVINLEEEAMKEGLIALGWTPPSMTQGETEGYLKHALSKVREEKDTYRRMYEALKEEVDKFKSVLKDFVEEE
jgi:hypothetical protein